MTENLVRKKTNWRRTGFILLLLAPAVLHLLIFWAGVQVQNFVLAFTNQNTGKFTFVGNFKYVWNALTGTGDPYLHEALGNTLLFFVSGCLLLPIGMFTGYLIYRKMLFANFTKIVLYLPGAISGIMLSVLYIQLMSADGPLFTGIFKDAMGGNSFLTEHGIAYILIYDIWVGLGGNLVIWLGGMSRIPTSLLESGQLDGITTFKEFTKIVLPLCWPTFVTMLTLQIIGIFGASGSVLLLTNGRYGTFTINFWLYYVVLNGQSDVYNYSAATGIFFTLLTIPLVFGGRWFMKKFGEAVEY